MIRYGLKRAIYEYLKDGAWHHLPDIIEAVGSYVRPESALSTYRTDARTKTQPATEDIAHAVVVGRLRYLRNYLTSEHLAPLIVHRRDGPNGSEYRIEPYERPTTVCVTCGTILKTADYLVGRSLVRYCSDRCANKVHNAMRRRKCKLKASKEGNGGSDDGVA